MLVNSLRKRSVVPIFATGISTIVFYLLTLIWATPVSA